LEMDGDGFKSMHCHILFVEMWNTEEKVTSHSSHCVCTCVMWSWSENWSQIQLERHVLNLLF
jgi:hypothetical protein